MSTSDVTRDGIRGARQGREALVGKGPEHRRAARRTGRDRRGHGQPGHRERDRGRRGGELVPEPEFDSYYGRPILNPPRWRPRDIAGYFFLGGLAGAGSVFAAGAQLTGRPATARALKISAAVSIAGSAVALINDLGRPARFPNMLRIFRPTSPMNMGSWLLAGYGPTAGAAAVLDVTGLLPRTGRAATAAAALLGPAVASYTAVLAADTAVPAWREAYRELPFVFVGSATVAASGMALIAAPIGENAPARSGAVLGAVLEFAATRVMERRLGMVAETYRRGRAGRLMRSATALSVLAAAGGALLGGRSRTAAVVSGAALLAASACTRFGVFHAGIRSAEDPAYTVVPQRRRLSENAAATPG